MLFVVVGCSYRTAGIELREQLAFPEDEIPRALRELMQRPDMQEVLLLSTCNRVEIWGVARRPGHARADLAGFLAEDRGVARDELDAALFSLQGEEALTHIFKVASSLDAMVIGEAQIIGQVKEAFAAASRAGTLGPGLNRCMHKALGAAKRARTETNIARHPVSVSSVAADLAGRIFGDLQRSVVLLLGAGEMSELAARHLMGNGARDLRVVNRTHERAVSMAFQLGATAHKYEDLGGQLLQADILVTSTSSKEPILTRDGLAKTMKGRRQRPLFIVDIAVPRDVETAAGKLPNLYLFDIDDLDQVVAENLKARHAEADRASDLVDQEVAHFVSWMKQQDAVPVIKELRGYFRQVVQAEVEHAARDLGLTEAQQQQILDRMSEAIVNKLLHGPTVELKSHAARSDGTFLAKAAKHLFRLAAAEEAAATSNKEK